MNPFKSKKSKFEDYLFSDISRDGFNALKHRFSARNDMRVSQVDVLGDEFIDFAKDECERVKVGCEKIRFHSRPAAKKRMKAVNLESGFKKIVRVYKCSVCDGYHMTSSNERQNLRYGFVLMVKNFIK